MTRDRLQNRRGCTTFNFEVGGQRFAATVSRYDDGRVAELFLNNTKCGNEMDSIARDSAVVFSFAVQHGADPNVIRQALSRDSQGRALGPLGTALDILAKQELEEILR